MPALSAELTVKLQAKPLGDALLGSVEGPFGNLHEIESPVTGDQLTGITAQANAVDLSAMRASLSQLASRAEPLLQSVGVPRDVMAPLTTALGPIRELRDQNVAQGLRDLVTSLSAEIEGARDGGLVAVLNRIAQLLAASPEGNVLGGLLASLTSGAGITLPSSFGLGDILEAADGSVRAIGGMMTLESVLSDAERLALTIGAQLDPDRLTRDLRQLQGLLDREGTTLPQFVSAVQADDQAAVAAAVNAIVTVAARLDAIVQDASAAMGLGEATLVYLDFDALQLEVAAAATLVRTADLAALGRLARALAGVVQPIVATNLTGVPARGADALLDAAEARVASVASSISAVDVAQFASPLSAGLNQMTAVLDSIGEVLARIRIAFESAVHDVRDAIRSLPFGAMADELRRLLEPITEVLDAIRSLVDTIQDALGEAAAATTEALGEIEGAVDTLKQQVETLFTEAKAFVDQLHLDQALGAVAENIKTFIDALEKAQMKPYFDTAVDAIGTTATVIGALPFGLLPDSMKSEVDAAVRPIKETDAQAVETEIESLLGIGADGTFDLRADLEDAIAEVQAQYDQLIAAVADLDPRKSLDEVDAKLQEIAQRVRELSPSLTLAPVQEAIDRVKSAIAAIDLDRELEPVRAVFAQIEAAMDRFKPSTLVAGIEDDIAALRTEIVSAIALDQWEPAIDDLLARANALLNSLDPARLSDQIASGLNELASALGGPPRRGGSASLGGLVASLLNGSGLRVSAESFDTVLTWIGGESGTAALNARVAHIADAIGKTRDGVAAFDLDALAPRIIQRIGELRPAATALAAALPPDTIERGQIEAALARLDGAAALGGLSSNRSRYLAELNASAPRARALGSTGFSEVDVTAANFRTALSPLQPAVTFSQDLLGLFGLAAGEGLTGVFRSIFNVASPERIAGLLRPVFVALRDRITTLVNAVFGPVKSGIQKLRALIGAIDIQPLVAALDTVFNEVKAEILAFSPDNILKEPLDAFKALQDDLQTLDPLAAILDILNNLRDTVARVLEKLNLEAMLATPLAIYDEIVAALAALDLKALLSPVLDELDNIAHQVDEGLDNTVAAFQQLQEALPGGGGGISGVSASVGIG